MSPAAQPAVAGGERVGHGVAQHPDHLRRFERAALEVALALGDEQERAAALLCGHVDAALAQRRAQLIRRVLAADVQAALAAREARADVLHRRLELLLRARVERADVIALLVSRSGGLRHVRMVGRGAAMLKTRAGMTAR